MNMGLRKVYSNHVNRCAGIEPESSLNAESVRTIILTTHKKILCDFSQLRLQDSNLRHTH